MADEEPSLLDELEDWSRKQLGQKTEDLQEMRDKGNWAAQFFTGWKSWSEIIAYITLGVVMGGSAYVAFLISNYLF